MTSSKPTVIMNGTEFGGSVSTITDEQRAEIVALAEAGVGRNEIARRTGLSGYTISTTCAAAGLGFAGAARTGAATQARIVKLRERRVDAAEQTHLAYEQALALAVLRMATRPDDARRVADLAKAAASLGSAYESLARIDARALGDFELEAAGQWADGVFVQLRELDVSKIRSGQVISIGGRPAVEPDSVEQEGADHDQPECTCTAYLRLAGCRHG